MLGSLGEGAAGPRYSVRWTGWREHAGDVSGWIKALKSDRRFIFEASHLSQRAVEFLSGDSELAVKEAA